MAKKPEKPKTQWFIRPKGSEANRMLGSHLDMLQDIDEVWKRPDDKGIPHNLYCVDRSIITEILRTSGNPKMFDIFNRKGPDGQLRRCRFFGKSKKISSVQSAD